MTTGCLILLTTALASLSANEESASERLKREGEAIGDSLSSAQSQQQAQIREVQPVSLFLSIQTGLPHILGLGAGISFMDRFGVEASLATAPYYVINSHLATVYGAFYFEADGTRGDIGLGWALNWRTGANVKAVRSQGPSFFVGAEQDGIGLLRMIYSLQLDPDDRFHHQFQMTFSAKLDLI